MHPVAIAAFANMTALSTSGHSRPFDARRDGFIMTEGSAALVLEEWDRAVARGATIYAELAGAASTADAHHITAPSPDGAGAVACMELALADARISVNDVGHINAHGTSTPLGDEIELGAVKRLFGDHAYSLSMSSTKSAIGHLLGAAGTVEAIFAILAMRDGVVPPTLNLDNPSAACDIDLVAKTAKERKVDYVLSNSFGFGGTNASLIFSRPDRAG